MASSDKERAGIWLVGARGSIGTTVMVGAAAVGTGLAPSRGCVTELAPLRDTGLVPIPNLVFGGCDIVNTPLRKRAEQLAAGGVFSERVVPLVGEHLDRADREIMLIDPADDAPQREQASQLSAALEAFRERTGVQRVTVINVASTEAHPAWDECFDDLDRLETAIATRSRVLPPSALYAYAAYRSRCAYVDFTPSLGVRVPALAQLAEAQGVPFAGSDGKTGETLLKSALAPVFSHRALRVRSWYGANILGGGDGATLNDYGPRDSKLKSKASGLTKLLGYDPENTVRIDYVAEMGDWKTAWNHISFEGFLGVQMKMQFTWQGCDSTLAAPLVLDLGRLMDKALRAGSRGAQDAMAFFFKDPVGTADCRLVMQYEALCEWARTVGVAA